MPTYKTIERVRHNGNSYEVGAEITDLNHEQAKRLLGLGVIEGELVEDPKPKTVDEFKKLSAQEQKDLLKFHAIAPADKADERVVQYTEWFGKQAIADVV